MNEMQDRQAANVSPIQDRTQEIKNEIALLNNALKMSVTRAIRIGELLTEQKAFVGHGNFLMWLEKNIDMSERTAQRYMALFSYRSKTANLSDLHLAYQQVETLKAQEEAAKVRAQMTPDERYRNMVTEFKKTGVRPLGWSPAIEDRMKTSDEAYRQLEEERRQAKKDREEADRLQRVKEAEEKEEATRSLPADTDYYYRLGKSTEEMIKNASATLHTKTQERIAWKEKIRLSDGGKEDAFMDAIVEYLETLADDNRRIEACSNIIKICRNISVELQAAG